MLMTWVGRVSADTWEKETDFNGTLESEGIFNLFPQSVPVVVVFTITIPRVVIGITGIILVTIENN